MKNKILIFLFLISNISFAQLAWYPLNTGTTSDLISINFINSNTGFAASKYNSSGNNSQIFKTTNAGLNWSVVYSQLNVSILKMQFVNSLTGYACGSGLIKTTNGGNNWTIINPLSVSYSYIYFLDALTGFSTQYTLGFCKTTNGGLNWTTITNLPSQNSILAYNFLNSNTGIIHGSYYYKVGNYGKSVFTKNGGANWSAPIYGEPGGLFITGGFVDSNFFFTCGGRIFARTTNGGTNWSNIIVAPEAYIKSVQFVNYSTGYLCYQNSSGSGGFVSYTTNGGTNWSASPILPAVPFWDICFTSDVTGYVCGNSGAIFKTTTGGVVTGFSNANSELPYNFFLSQNYPNPFNPLTQINYELPISNYVSLKVYDALGNEVQTIVNEKQNAGSYSVSFNGEYLPSGIYFYKLEAGDFKETKKMVLVK